MLTIRKRQGFETETQEVLRAYSKEQEFETDSGGPEHLYEERQVF